MSKQSFKNKTALKELHNYDFDKFLDVLKENRKNITMNLTERETHERLEKHFDKSVSILTPLKARINATDNLIDEIKIVEGKT